jgi:hypothetical protein
VSDATLGESDWEDQDLLTLDEAGERLSKELVAAQEAADAARDAGDQEAAQRHAARAEAVTEALDRIRGLSES